MADTRTMKVLVEYHTYLRQTAVMHMTWFAFHFGSNLLVFDKARSWLKPEFAVAFNVIGAFGTCLVAWDRWRTVQRMKVMEAKEDPDTAMTNTVPVRLWTWISVLLAVVCLIFAYAWLVAPPQSSSP